MKLRSMVELPEHQREVVIFAMATGLRQANVLGLEWSRVDLEAGHAWLPGLSRSTVTNEDDS